MLYRDQGVVLRSIKLGETDRIVTDPGPGARQDPSRRQGCAQARQPVRGAARAHDPPRVPVLPGPQRPRRRHPGGDHRLQPRACGSTTAASPTRCRCSRPPTRSRRIASRTCRSTGCSSGALRTLAAEPSPLVSAAFFWKLLALEGFHPLLDVCARCGNESDVFPAFDLLEGGVLCETCGSLARSTPPTRVAGAAPPDPGRRAADRARRATECGHDRHRAPGARRRRAPHRTSPAQRRAAVASEPRCDSRSVTPIPERGSWKRLPATIVFPYGQGRPDGPRRQPGETSRLRLPIERDLRRLPVHLGLRAARCAAQAQREGRVVALDGAAP